MERAMQLLQHNELMIADIARLVGFADQSHFTRQFKRLVGTTPLKFRVTVQGVVAATQLENAALDWAMAGTGIKTSCW
jgi:AraC-like DNA-binding protein